MRRRCASSYWTYAATFVFTFLFVSFVLRDFSLPRGLLERREKVGLELKQLGRNSLRPPAEAAGGNLGLWEPGDLVKKSGDNFQPRPSRLEDEGQGEIEDEKRQEEEKEEEEISNSTESDECPPDSSREVILLTYGRSGSTLTTDIINLHPDVFMYFEPLHNLAKTFTTKQTEHKEQTGQYLHLTEIPEYNIAAQKTVEKLLTCNYFRLSRLVTLNLHAPKHESTKEMFHCIKSAMTSKGEENCLLEGQERCDRKPLKFTKLIRIKVSTVAPLMQVYPCMKLVYLVRDPRGSYLSKHKMFHSHGSNATFDAQRFCSRLNKDVDEILKLKREFPDRVFMTRFESIATHPIVSSKRLYEFIGLEFTKQEAMLVYNKTHSESGSDNYGTDRANSTATCYKWRDTIPYDFVEAFDNFCSEPYYKLGYLPANSEKDIRDKGKPLLFFKDFYS